MKYIEQLGLFLTIGLVSAGVNFFTFYVVWSLLGASYLVASSMAYLLSVVAHFLGNRNFTFKAGRSDFIPQIRKYIILVAVNYCITMLAMSTSVELLHFSPFIGVVIAIALTVGVGFLLSKQWVFNES